MQWREVHLKINELYSGVSTWVYNHPVETDILIIGAVLFGIYKYTRRDVRRKRRHIRFVRGDWMSRQDRERYQLMRFEDAIGDAALDMLMEGRMSEKEEKEWYRLFAERYNMPGLLPRRDNETIKRGIRGRIRFYRRRLKLPAMFGGGVRKVIPDKGYVPETDTGLAKSKFYKKEK